MDTNHHEKLLGVGREFYAKLCYTHKTHEKQRELCSNQVRCVKWWNVIVVGLTTILAILGVVTSYKSLSILSGILASVSTAFVVYQLNFNPEKTEAEHRTVAKRLLSLRDQYLILIQKIMVSSLSEKELEASIGALQKEVCTVYEYAPDTSPKAYSMAHRGINIDEEYTFKDGEIDALLPEKLRTGPLKEKV